LRLRIGNQEFLVVGGGVSILFRHVIAVVVKIGLVESPGPVATLLLNQNRKRGKPQNNPASIIRATK
jgi:hypothetical protein